MVQSPGSSEMKRGEKADVPAGCAFPCTVQRCLVLLGIFILLTATGVGIRFWVKSLPNRFHRQPFQDSAAVLARCTNVTTEMEWDPKNPFGNAGGKKVFFRINRSNFLLEGKVEGLPNRHLLCHENWDLSLGNLICRQLGHFQLTHHKGVNLTDVKVGITQEFLQVSPNWKENAKERWHIRRRCSSGRIVALKCSECGMKMPETTGRKDQPWQVGLHLNGKRLCGGALLSRQWIVSAAHCMDSSPNFSNWVALVGLGLPTRSKEGARQAMDKIILHPSYNPVNHDYDLAMLKIKEPLSFSDAIQAVCLPPYHQDISNGSTCWISGQVYPRQENSTVPIAEMWSEMPVALQSPKDCNGSCVDVGEITPRMMCAHYLDGTIGACKGESGGALVCQHEHMQHLVGIGIQDDGCKQPKGPGLYTKVASLLDWIHRVMEAD